MSQLSSLLPVVAVVAAGVALGVAFTLSPLTILVGLACALGLARFARTLPPDERWWFVRLFGVALALRIAAIGALFLVSGHDSQASGILFGDEAYALARSWRIRNVVLGIPQIKYDYMIAFEGYGRSSFLQLMTYLQVLVGPAPYGLRVLNAALFLGAVLLLFRMTRRAFGAFTAFAGSFVLLFLPTLFAWSISLLKESFYFVLTVAVLAAAVELTTTRTSWRMRGVCVLGAAGALMALSDLREGAVSLAVSGIAAGLAGAYVLGRRSHIVMVAAAMAALAVAVLVVPSLQSRALTYVGQAATANAGHVFTVGHGYKLLDEEFYVIPGAKPQFDLSLPEAGRYVVRAVASYVAVPLPWQMETRGEVVYLPEQIFWYALLILAPFGAVAAAKRDRTVAALLVAYVVPTAIVVAMTTGNVGTLIRHRTLIVPFLVWIGALGFAAVMARLLQRREIAV
jgi:hypothetical protein